MLDLIISNRDLLEYFLFSVPDFKTLTSLQRLNKRFYNLFKKKSIKNNFKQIREDYVLNKIYNTKLFVLLKNLTVVKINENTYTELLKVNMLNEKANSVFESVTNINDYKYTILRYNDAFICLNVKPKDEKIKEYDLYFNKVKVNKKWLYPLPICSIAYVNLELTLLDKNKNPIKDWILTYGSYFYYQKLRVKLMHMIYLYFFGTRKSNIFIVDSGQIYQKYSK